MHQRPFKSTGCGSGAKPLSSLHAALCAYCVPLAGIALQLL
jgi:hypothetical protein